MEFSFGETFERRNFVFFESQKQRYSSPKVTICWRCTAERTFRFNTAVSLCVGVSSKVSLMYGRQQNLQVARDLPFAVVGRSIIQSRSAHDSSRNRPCVLRNTGPTFQTIAFVIFHESLRIVGLFSAIPKKSFFVGTLSRRHAATASKKLRSEMLVGSAELVLGYRNCFGWLFAPKLFYIVR